MNLLRRGLRTIDLWPDVLPSLMIMLTSFLVLDTAAQDCTVFVNPSDGSDTNSGSQFQPLLSLESGYNATPDGAILCLAAGEYFQAADADGIILADLSKSVTIRLTEFAGANQFLFSEDFFVSDTGTGSISFERSGTENVVFGLGQLNTDVLSPDETNFLHTFEVRSGTLDFGSIPVTFQESVGNTLYISPDNSDKVAPSSASITHGGLLIGSEILFSSSPRSWIVNGGLLSQSRTISIPELISQSTLSFSHLDSVTLSSVLMVQSGSSVSITSTSSGPIVFDSGISLGGGSTFTHSGPQSLDLDITLFGQGRAELELNGPGVHTIQNLSYTEMGEINVNAVGGVTAFSSSATIRGSLLVEASLQTTAAITVIATDTSSPVLSLSGTLNHGPSDFVLINEAGSTVPIVISPGSLLSGNPLIVSGDFVLRGGGATRIETTTDSDIHVESIIIENDVSLGQDASITIKSSGATFQQTLSVEGGILTIFPNASPLIGSLTGSSGTIVGNESVIRIGNSVSIANTGVSDLGITIDGSVSSNVSSDVPLLSITAVGSHIQLASDLSIENECSFSGGTLNLNVSSQLSCASFVAMESARVVLGTGSTLSSSSDMSFMNAVLDAGVSSSLEVASTLLLNSGSQGNADVTLVWTGTNHVLASENGSTWQTMSWVQPTATTTIEGDVTFLATQTYLQNNVHLSEGTVLRLESNLTIEAGVLTFEPSSTLVFRGSTLLRSDSPAAIELPTIEFSGSNLIIDHNTTVLGDFTQAGGRLEITDALLVSIENDLLFSAGDLILNTGSTLSSGGSMTLFGASLNLGVAATLDVGSDLTIGAGSVSSSSSVLRLSGTGGVILPDGFSVEELVVSGTGTQSTLVGEGALSVLSILTVGMGSSLDLGLTDMILGQAGAQADLSVEGSVVGSAGGGLIVLGASASWSGSGLVQDLHLRLDDGSSELTYSGVSAHLGRSLNFESGILNTGSASVHFDTSSGFDITVDIQEETYSGMIASSNPSQINPENTSIDLTITGMVSGFPSFEPYLALGPVRDLTILAVDALNSPPLFGPSASLPQSISGSLILQPNSVLQVPSILLTGFGTHNLIAGFTQTVTLAGSGSVEGLNTGRIDQLSFTGADYALMNLSQVGSFSVQSGDITIGGEGPLVIAESFLVESGSLTLETSLNLDRDLGLFEFTVADLPIVLGPGSGINFMSPSIVSFGSGASVSLLNAGAEDGYLTFFASATLNAGSNIPRLRLAHENSAILLQSDLTVQDAFESLDGTITMGAQSVELNSAAWLHSGTRFLGDQSSPESTIRVVGESEITLKAPLLIEFSSLELLPQSSTISFVQGGSGAIYSMTVPNGSVTFGEGNVSLGKTDLILRGNVEPLLMLSSSTILGDVEYPDFDNGSRIATGKELFPFKDDLVGEVVVDSPGTAIITSTGSSQFSALRIQQPVSIAPSSSPIQIINRLVFGQNGAQIAMDSPGKLVLADNALILRRGQGILTHPPEFLGPVNLAFELDDGSVTGQDQDFQASELISGLEIPPVSTGINNLIVMAGNTGSTTNRLTINRPIRLEGTGIVWSGELSWSGADVVLDDGARLGLLEVDIGVAPLLTADGPYAASGTIDLFARPISSSLALSTTFFPPDVVVDSLEFDVGSSLSSTTPDLIMSGDRTARDITFSGIPGSSLNMTGYSLSATNSLVVLSGTVFSDPTASLQSAGTFFLGISAVINGNTQIEVDGSSIVNGNMQALSFTTSGDLTMGGQWDSFTSLSLTGDSQTVLFSSPDLVFSQLSRSSTLPLSQAIFRGPVNSVLRVTGSLQLNSGLIVLDSATILLDLDVPIIVAENSWIVGPVEISTPSGFTGSIPFPVGIESAGRPIDLILTQPLLAASSFQMNVTETEPEVETGLPMSIGGSSIEDTDTFSWTLKSSVNFSNVQSFSLSAPKEGLSADAVALLTMPVGESGAVWQTGVFSSETTLRSAILSRGLSQLGLRVSPGVGHRNGDRVFVQMVDDWVQATSPEVDIYLNEELWLSDISFRQTSAAIPVSAPPTGGIVLITVSLSGEQRVPGLVATTAIDVQPDKVSYLALASNFPGIPALLVSAPIEMTAGLSTVNLGSEQNVVTVEELWPVTTTVVENLPGRQFSSSIYASDLSSAFRIGSSDGRSSLSKFDVTSSLQGPALLVIYDDFTAAVITEDGVLFGSIDATSSEEKFEIPGKFELSSVFPNPAGSAPSLMMNIPGQGSIRIQIFDMIGRLVTSSNESLDRPTDGYTTALDTSRLVSGAYFVRVTFHGQSHSTTRTLPFVLTR